MTNVIRAGWGSIVGARFVPSDPLFGVPDRWEPGDYRKDKGQRAACGCIMPKDIGEYNTCPHLCKYCYANVSEDVVLANSKSHKAGSCASSLIPRVDDA